MALTYGGFITNLMAMSVTGVASTSAAPPRVDASANYPQMFPRLPEGEREILTVGSTAGLTSAVVDVVVVIERDALNLSETNFDDTVTIMDALNSALVTEAAANNEIDSWSFEALQTEWGWSVVARVEGSG